MRICSKSEKKIKEIASLLLQKKLAIDLNLRKNATRLELLNGKLEESKIYILTGKTKALLFSRIDKLLKKKYGELNMPEIYSLAVVHMDWEQADDLTKGVAKV